MQPEFLTDPCHYSIEHLVRQALAYRLISDYRMTSEALDLEQASGVMLRYSPETARVFLHGLVSGYEIGQRAGRIQEEIAEVL